MPSSNIVDSGGSIHYRFQSQIWVRYICELSLIYSNPFDALNEARMLGPQGIPYPGEPIPGGSGIFATTFDMERTRENRHYWNITVNYAPPPTGETAEDQEQVVPTDRTPVVQIYFRDTEGKLAEMTVKEALSGMPNPIAAGTKTKIVNALGEPDYSTQAFNVVRNPVFVISENVATVGPIIQRNKDYLRTTNETPITYGGVEIGERELKFLGAYNDGYQIEGPYGYFRMRTEIEWTEDTTDYVMDNKSAYRWDDGVAPPEKKRITVKTGKKEYPIVTPQFITHAGKESDDPVSITWQLDLKDFSSLFP